LREFTDDDVNVEFLIYKIEGNDGWSSEVALDEETAVIWTEVFPTYQKHGTTSPERFKSWLRQVIDADDGEDVTLH
jgi:hypothetical protein